jgi:hypothetical protein
LAGKGCGECPSVGTQFGQHIGKARISGLIQEKKAGWLVEQAVVSDNVAEQLKYNIKLCHEGVKRYGNSLQSHGSGHPN